jgi:hypothetical protein
VSEGKVSGRSISRSPVYASLTGEVGRSDRPSPATIGDLGGRARGCQALDANQSVGSVLAMTHARRRVVLTGAAGRIGRAITLLLPADWDVQRTDLTTSEDISPLDISNPDACRAALAGADAVVHLAAVPDPEAS